MSSPDSQSAARLSELMLHYEQSTLTPVELNELCELLRACPEHRQWAVEHLVMSSLLTETIGPHSRVSNGPIDPDPSQVSSSQSEVSVTRKRASSSASAGGHDHHRVRINSGTLALGLAMSLLLMLGLILVMRPQVVNERFVALSAPPATILEMQNAIWSQGHKPLSNGSPANQGTYELTSGIAVFEFRCGAVLRLKGPAKLTVLSERTASLDAGVASVRAPESAIGFTLKTPSSDYVDLGTEFGVMVDAQGRSELHVSQGVVIARPRGTGMAVPILDREASRVEDGQLYSVTPRFEDFPGLNPPEQAAKIHVIASDVSPQIERPKLGPESRVIFLGERALSIETHTLLMRQAWEDAKITGPKLLNSSVAYRFNHPERDYDRYVTAHRPTHAVLSFGHQMLVVGHTRPLTPEAYLRNFEQIIDRLEADGIVPIILISLPIAVVDEEMARLLSAYDDELIKLAHRRQLWTIDFREDARLATPNSYSLGLAPNYDGYRVLARRLLDEFGYARVELPESLSVKMLPGAVTKWQYQFISARSRLTFPELNEFLVTSKGWRSLKLPQRDDLGRRVVRSYTMEAYRDRSRGYATLVRSDDWSEDELVLARSTVTSSELAERKAYLNLGGQVQQAWVNGQEVYLGYTRYNGWHAGRERIPITLQPGENSVVILSGDVFVVNITEEFDWQ